MIPEATFLLWGSAVALVFFLAGMGAQLALTVLWHRTHATRHRLTRQARRSAVEQVQAVRGPVDEHGCTPVTMYVPPGFKATLDEPAPIEWRQDMSALQRTYLGLQQL